MITESMIELALRILKTKEIQSLIEKQMKKIGLIQKVVFDTIFHLNKPSTFTVSKVATTVS